MKRCIIIPIYTDKLSSNEILSVLRSKEIFYNEEIVILTFKELPLQNIEKLLYQHKNIRIEYFDRWYFKNVNRYNQLMLSRDFYERFRQYEYILICQTDVYIFSNQLAYWCNKGYDYVGAPLFKHHSKDFGGCFNGGFSLRRVPAFIDKYSDFRTWSRFLCKSGKMSFPSLLKYIFCIATYYSIKLHVPRSSSGEDTIWSRLDNVPSFEISAMFSFEKYPSHLFSITHQIPFGCHAYFKWDDGFYKKYINYI